VFLAIAASAHFASGFFWSAGGWEYPVLWTLAALHFAVSGGGRHSKNLSSRRAGLAPRA
jgi:putative oxidoreductase